MYVGSTIDLKLRIEEHARGAVSSTKERRPLELVYYEACIHEKLARQREQYLKTGYGRSFLKKRIGDMPR